MVYRGENGEKLASAKIGKQNGVTVTKSNRGILTFYSLLLLNKASFPLPGTHFFEMIILRTFFISLQNNSCNQRYPKRTGYRRGDYLEIERYEQLKQERDAIWKNWIDKLAAEKDDIIQQLKLDKMEVRIFYTSFETALFIVYCGKSIFLATK